MEVQISIPKAALLAFKFAGLPAFAGLAESTAGKPQSDEVPIWMDPSPHAVQFVTVDSNVNLEVLDWDGTGRPIVLLAGYLTAHPYDEFAPALTELGHVYGITRRALGGSMDTGKGFGRATDLRGDRRHGCPLRPVLSLVLSHHPHGTFTNLW